MGAICDPASWTDQAIGEMPGSVEIKLVDVPDLGYFSNHIPGPQGEIWIRGAAVTEGYLDLEEENKQSFHDGWFKTGDIGEFDEDGRLRVIDRKKNMVKTLNGEYIALVTRPYSTLAQYKFAWLHPKILTFCGVHSSLARTRPSIISIPVRPPFLPVS